MKITTIIKSFLLVMVCISAQAKVTTLNVPIGNSNTKLEITENGHGPTFIHLHEDEQAAYQATKKILEKKPGKLIAIKQRGQRLVSFTLSKKTYAFDPNRIFTDIGIRKTLQRYGPYSNEAFLAVKAYRNTLLKHIAQPKILIAVHNNYNKGYSLRNYKRNGDLAIFTSAIHDNPKQSDGNFYFVTADNIFDQLKKHNQNAVLQTKKKITGDGSLAEYAAMHDINYVNIEAQRHHLSSQISMINLLLTIV